MWLPHHGVTRKSPGKTKEGWAQFAWTGLRRSQAHPAQARFALRHWTFAGCGADRTPSPCLPCWAAGIEGLVLVSDTLPARIPVVPGRPRGRLDAAEAARGGCGVTPALTRLEMFHSPRFR